MNQENKITKIIKFLKTRNLFRQRRPKRKLLVGAETSILISADDGDKNFILTTFFKTNFKV